MLRGIFLDALLPLLTPHALQGRTQEKRSGGETKATSRSAEPKVAISSEELIDRIFAREKQVDAAISSYAPIVETYIQQTKKDPAIGVVPVKDYYFLGTAEFTHGIRLRPIVAHPRTGNVLWSFNPAGFLAMVFLDLGGFDKQN